MWISVPARIHHISSGGHLQVKKGGSVRIECSASGNPRLENKYRSINLILIIYFTAPTLHGREETTFYRTVSQSTWYLISTLLFYFISSGEEKLQSPVLSIENMDRHKGGVYICQANNGVGKPASSQVVLHVLCEYCDEFIMRRFLTKRENVWKTWKSFPINNKKESHRSEILLKL